jgi:hypothetical protein
MAHAVSLRPGSSRKSTHKRVDDSLSEKERLANFDEDEATVVRLTLAEDSDFQAKGQRIALTPAGERLAEREAASYAPYRTAGRRVIAELLLHMAEEPWRSRGSRAWLFFANLDRKAIWVDDPSLDDLAARRVRERWESLRVGAQSLAYFGAGRCIGCGSDLGARQYRRGAWGRRTRRKHCEACLDSDPRKSLCARREADMRKAVDVLTGARQRHRTSRRTGGG